MAKFTDALMVVATATLVILTALAVHRSHTAPQPRPSDAKLDRTTPTLVSKYFSWWIWSFKYLIWTAAAYEIYRASSSGRKTILNRTRILGGCIAVSGALFRARCFRILGQRFTFQLATHGGSGLVTTGPYAVVRHPSYLGGLICFYGALIVFLHPFESARGAVGVTLFSASILPVLWTRIVKEEAMLEREFKDEWKVYTRRVPSRVIPGIL